jgi:hypothetical protein
MDSTNSTTFSDIPKDLAFLLRQWSKLPKGVKKTILSLVKYGKWGTVYLRFRRWIDKWIFDLIAKELQTEAIAIKGTKSLFGD